MKKLFSIVALLLCLIVTDATAGPVGTWNAYPAYTDIKRIEDTGSIVFVLASGGLYSYNPTDQSIQTYDKVNALSDCGISDIAWCRQAGRLVVVYENYNIDLVSADGKVTNMSEYYNKSLTEDKTINNITINGTDAYLSTGFGIVRIDVRNAAISDTYNLGVKVNATALSGNYIFAATADGMYRASMNDNLADKSKWTRYSTKTFTHLLLLNGELIGLNNGEAFVMDKTADKFEQFYTPWFSRAKISGDRMLCYGTSHTYIIKSTDKKQDIAMSFGGIEYSPSDDSYWLNDTDGKLTKVTIDDNGNIQTSLTGVAPEGPKYNYFGFMNFINGKLYTCGGRGDPIRNACIQVYDKSKGWTIYPDDFASTLDYNYKGAMSLDIDPKDPSHLFMGSQAGMYEFRNGELVNIFTLDNSPLQGAKVVPDNNKKNYTLVSSVKFDSEGRLWCLNSVASSASLFEYSDGNWTSHHKSELVNSEGYSMANMVGTIFDSRNLMWFCSTDWRKPALICYQPSTDALKLYSRFINQDGTSLIAENVTCVQEDLEGNIWIGTAAGPLMLTAADIANGNETFTQVKVPRNDGTNYADYLLDGISISSIAIDGGGRKWFGTDDSGVFLISADNMTQLQHFTAENSSLLSDVIESVAIDGTTGEVFFGTDKGLCSYMSDASQTSEKMDKDNVYAYPNPVRPDYTGLITVTGLTLNADVKIVTVNGTLVAEGRSNGGMFTWDGCDKSGRRVASGVYMVQTATSDGKKGTVCKIAIVN